MKKKRTEFLRKHWQLIGLLILIALQLAAIPIGVVFFVIGDVLHITFHGLVMTLYKAEQKRRAVQHHLHAMDVVRRPIVESLSEQFPEHSEKIKRIAGKYQPFDFMRQELERKVPDLTLTAWQETINGIRLFGVKPPSVEIVVPIYDIAHEILHRQIESMAAQTYPGPLAFTLVLNDSTDEDTLLFLIKEADIYTRAKENVEFIVLVEGKAGKREAQMTGFRHAFESKADFIGNFDGDGFCSPDNVVGHVLTMLADPHIGLTSGDVRIINSDENFLTRQTAMRYFTSGWDERSSQKDQMICGSGPNLMMRAAALQAVAEEWYTESWMGVRIHYGDDRALTLLIMSLGWGTVFVPDTIVWTDCPSEYDVYMRQQVRWNRSATRYNWKMYKSGQWAKLNWYVRFSVAFLTFYPLIVLTSIGVVLLRAMLALVNHGPMEAIQIVLPYVLVVIALGFVFQTISGVWLMRQAKFFTAPLYVVLWFRIQIPSRIKAFRTLTEKGWGTRKPRQLS